MLSIHIFSADLTSDDITVVCFSLGVGRTGVFCVVASCIERLKLEGVVDVFQTVKMMRTQRMSMVNTAVRIRRRFTRTENRHTCTNVLLKFKQSPPSFFTRSVLMGICNIRAVRESHDKSLWQQKPSHDIQIVTNWTQILNANPELHGN